MVYTAGYYFNGTIQIPCYWAGAALVPLAGDGTHNAASHLGICLCGNGLYGRILQRWVEEYTLLLEGYDP